MASLSQFARSDSFAECEMIAIQVEIALSERESVCSVGIAFFATYVNCAGGIVSLVFTPGGVLNAHLPPKFRL